MKDPSDYMKGIPMSKKTIWYIGDITVDLSLNTKENLSTIFPKKRFVPITLHQENKKYFLYQVDEEMLATIIKLQTRYGLIFRIFKRATQFDRIRQCGLEDLPKKFTAGMLEAKPHAKLTTEEKRQMQAERYRTMWINKFISGVPFPK